MNSSFLYYAWGLYNHICTHQEYKGIPLFCMLKQKSVKLSVPNANAAIG